MKGRESAYRIVPGQPALIPDLLRLQRTLNDHLPSPAGPEGVLFGEALTWEDLQVIAEADELTVCLFEERVVGYYLLDNYSRSRALIWHRRMVANCVDLGVLPALHAISLRAQCVVDARHQRQGVSRRLLAGLLTQLKGRYDSLAGTISTFNPTLPAHQRLGWQIRATFGDAHLLLHELK
ncbi:MAG: GNAT family N-acetyltransferase [Deltaproteobacteria bacterium]|nr:GNAT family N-acetyltransferase [Deltaproteobacteria bacterium]